MIQAQPCPIAQKLAFSMNRLRKLEHKPRFRNPVTLEHYRFGRLIGVYNTLNDITNVGKNNIFDVYFNGGTQTANTSWCIGLINASGFSTNPVTDTMSSHAGWTEFTSYTESTRVAWGSGTASGQSVTNASPAVFDINASGTVHGVFITTNNTKSGNTGTLWATALFGADVPTTNGDQLKITYTVSA